MYRYFPSDTSLNWNLEFENNFKSEFDIYFSKDFFELFKTPDNGEPYLFYFKKGQDIVLYPFLMKKINDLEFLKKDKLENLYDISTPYGYGGPLSNTNDKVFIEEFKNEFEDFCVKHKVITEFVRFHPLLGNQDNFKNIIDIKFDRKTVMIDLSPGENALWDNMDAKNRNIIRSAQKNGVKIVFDFELKEIDKFIAIYNESMKRIGAGKYYYFPKEFYNNMIQCLKDNVFLVSSVKDDMLLGMSLFFKFNGRIHYFLSGNNDLGYKYDANNLLLYEVARWGIENGFTQFHLGGGKTNAPDDLLFKFKKKFNKNGTVDFYIAKKIHNEKLYNKLKSDWKGYYHIDSIENETYFPVYREPL